MSNEQWEPMVFNLRGLLFWFVNFLLGYASSLLDLV